MSDGDAASPAAVGRLAGVPIREVWPGEVKHFTPWLAANLDELGEALRLDLELVETEKTVGSFQADMLLRTGDGETVVVENTYGTSSELPCRRPLDHRHRQAVS